ncbi:MAG TPA: superoxide dismutase [Spirochaetales bacterium]|nr:superoxide dismutase [Spirochaetales bacterium]HRY56204.1 superoxide dismutase [Spirochaetia bacterium]HRZ64034.1 superoxide dismutase [Spirochaetia bacterium]
MSFNVPDLRYPYDALEPHIDAQTMAIHHGKHHGAYVANLNKAVEGTEYASWAAEALARDWAKLPEGMRAAVRNNGGGHYNHALLWESIGPGGGGRPSGSLGAAVDRELGGFDALKAELVKAGLGRFGSGWAWLSLGPGKKLLVESTANQDSPLAEGRSPVLGIDVWEHAYYLKYQNRRADYLEAFFKVIDWKAVGERYAALMEA